MRVSRLDSSFMVVTYAFEGFVLDPGRRRLIRDSGETVTIQAKAFDALVCLVEHAGDVVPRALLAKTLWPTTVVEDNNLSQTIRALRNALDDVGPGHRYVLTVPRRGYQFAATVTTRPRSDASDRKGWRPFWLALAVVIAIAAFALLAQRRPVSQAYGPDRIVATLAKPDWSPRPAGDRERAELQRRLGIHRT